MTSQRRRPGRGLGEAQSAQSTARRAPVHDDSSTTPLAASCTAVIARRLRTESNHSTRTCTSRGDVAVQNGVTVTKRAQLNWTPSHTMSRHAMSYSKWCRTVVPRVQRSTGPGGPRVPAIMSVLCGTVDECPTCPDRVKGFRVKAVAPPGGEGKASPLWVDVQKLCNMCVFSLSRNFFVSHDEYIARPSSKQPR